MEIKYKTIEEVGSFEGKRILLRLDVNVPVKDGRIIEDFRLKKSFTTINLLREKKAKIIIIGHLESKETKSLEVVYRYLKNYFAVTFVPSPLVVDDTVKHAVEDLEEGEIILLENLRQNPGEMANSVDFAKELASLADVYVNEGFSVSHRNHASIVGVPMYLPSYSGILFQEEVVKLSQCFTPAKPFTFILGGAKFDTKLPLVKKFLTIADHVYIGGALANDCYKQKGLNVGVSLLSTTAFDLKDIIEDSKTVLPSDVVVKNGEEISVKLPSEVSDQDKILDAGPKSVEDLRKLVNESKFVLWNGPLGNYENGFKQPTIELAKMIAESGAQAVLGGGDTLAVISELQIEDKFYFVSSAGGAMLDFLANETLPGIEALNKAPKA